MFSSIIIYFYNYTTCSYALLLLDSLKIFPFVPHLLPLSLPLTIRVSSLSLHSCPFFPPSHSPTLAIFPQCVCCLHRYMENTIHLRSPLHSTNALALPPTGRLPVTNMGVVICLSPYFKLYFDLLYSLSSVSPVSFLSYSGALCM